MECLPAPALSCDPQARRPNWASQKRSRRVDVNAMVAFGYGTSSRTVGYRMHCMRLDGSRPQTSPLGESETEREICYHALVDDM